MGYREDSRTVTPKRGSLCTGDSFTYSSIQSDHLGCPLLVVAFFLSRCGDHRVRETMLHGKESPEGPSFASQVMCLLSLSLFRMLLLFSSALHDVFCTQYRPRRFSYRGPRLFPLCGFFDCQKREDNESEAGSRALPSQAKEGNVATPLEQSRKRAPFLQRISYPIDAISVTVNSH